LISIQIKERRGVLASLPSQNGKSTYQVENYILTASLPLHCGMAAPVSNSSYELFQLNPVLAVSQKYLYIHFSKPMHHLQIFNYTSQCLRWNWRVEQKTSYIQLGLGRLFPFPCTSVVGKKKMRMIFISEL
jgi:hypothetical protein